MNINDIESPELIPESAEDIWATIFTKQKQLHESFGVIETDNGLGRGLTDSNNIDDKRFQYYIKDLMWRVVEELMEAKEAENNNEMLHQKEEIIDALHFLVELCIVLDFPPDIMNHSHESPGLIWGTSHATYGCIYHLGLAGNCLKNKPWKQDFKTTDVEAFTRHIKLACKEFAKLLQVSGFSTDETYIYYFKKHGVNEFRIRSKY